MRDGKRSRLLRPAILTVVAALLLGAVAAAAVLQPPAGQSKEAAAMPTVSAAATDALQKLTTTRVYFGHQSVGQNVLDGLQALARRTKVALAVAEPGPTGTGVAGTQGGVVLHSFVGQNGDPISKIHDFAATFRGIAPQGVDVAMMKFCYVDSGNGIAADVLAHEYLAAMKELEQAFPKTTFVYVTMPLTAPRRDIKGIVKRVLGMPTRGREDNIERNRFNDIIRAHTRNTGRLFDLAAVESTTPNGTAYMVAVNGTLYEALYPLYTVDGGHLNEAARLRAADRLATFLAGLPRRR